MAKRTKEIINLIKRVKKDTGFSNRELAKSLGNTNAGQLTTSSKARPTIPDDLVTALKKLDKKVLPQRVFRIPKATKKRLKQEQLQRITALEKRGNLPKKVAKEIKNIQKTQERKKTPKVSSRIQEIRGKAGKKATRRAKKYQRFICRVTCDTDSFNKYTHFFNFVADGRNKKTRASLQRRAKRLHKEIFADHRPTSTFEVS